jgi:hypothetical protein
MAANHQLQLAEGDVVRLPELRVPLRRAAIHRDET